MLETIIFNSLSKYAAPLSHTNTSNRIYSAHKKAIAQTAGIDLVKFKNWETFPMSFR